MYLSSHNDYKQLKARDNHGDGISSLAQPPQNEDHQNDKESIL